MQPRSNCRSPLRSAARLFGTRAIPTPTRQATTAPHRDTEYIHGLIDDSNPPQCCDALSPRRRSPATPLVSTHRERSEKSGSWPRKNQSHPPTPGAADNRDSYFDNSFSYYLITPLLHHSNT